MLCVSPALAIVNHSKKARGDLRALFVWKTILILDLRFNFQIELCERPSIIWKVLVVSNSWVKWVHSVNYTMSNLVGITLQKRDTKSRSFFYNLLPFLC